jgi:hypothetical protein
MQFAYMRVEQIHLAALLSLSPQVLSISVSVMEYVASAIVSSTDQKPTGKGAVKDRAIERLIMHPVPHPRR